MRNLSSGTKLLFIQDCILDHLRCVFRILIVCAKTYFDVAFNHTRISNEDCTLPEYYKPQQCSLVFCRNANGFLFEASECNGFKKGQCTRRLVCICPIWYGCEFHGRLLVSINSCIQYKLNFYICQSTVVKYINTSYF